MSATTMPTAQMIEAADAVTVVLDRTADDDDIDAFRRLGGGWSVGIDLWRSRTHAFLILCASTRRRMKLRAPLVIMADDVQTAASVACEQLDNVKCAWLFAASDATRERVLEVTLADAVIEGHA